MGVDRLFARPDESWSPKRPRRLTYWLVGVTVAIFFLEKLIAGMSDESGVATGRIISEWFALSPGGLRAGRIWQLFTYQFLHGSAMHLVFNMLVLFFLGTFLEDRHGPKRLLWTYLLCGAVAGLACFLEAGSVVGASGAIMALIVILAVQSPNQQVLLFFFPIKLKYLAILLVAIYVLSIAGGNRGGSAHFVHLAGALAGFGAAYLMPRIVQPRVREFRQKRKHKRNVAEIERSLQEEQEMNRILDKITEGGMDSLSEEERQFLVKASRKLQSSRRS